MAFKTIEDIEVADKRVFFRADYNVPLDADTQKITDTLRIRKSVPSLQNLMKRQAKVFVFSHLGRPQHTEKKYSLFPVKQELEKLLQKDVFFCASLLDDDMEQAIAQLPSGECTLMENTRFHPQEKEGDEKFARHISQFFDIYVNDAFASIHNSDASLVAIPEKIDTRVCGYLLEKELRTFNEMLEKPQRPFTVILGGVKISDKIPMLLRLVDVADNIIIGGAMAYTFLAAQNISIGKSLLSEKDIPFAHDFLKQCSDKKVNVFLPLDHIVTDSKTRTEKILTDDVKIFQTMQGVDIGEKTIACFQEVVEKSKTIFWNGPLGIFENKAFRTGTQAIAECIATHECISLIGGGDTASAISQCSDSEKYTHISTGGGASLKLIQGTTLPSLELLDTKE